MNARTAELRRLMRAHGITAKEAGELIGRAGKTVRAWRSKTDDARVIPEHALIALKVKLSERSA